MLKATTLLKNRGGEYAIAFISLVYSTLGISLDISLCDLLTDEKYKNHLCKILARQAFTQGSEIASNIFANALTRDFHFPQP